MGEFAKKSGNLTKYFGPVNEFKVFIKSVIKSK